MNHIKPSINIAIAEDHAMVREMLTSTINTWKGFKVTVAASNGLELLSQFSALEEKPQVCILDINMHLLNGYETLLQIRKLYPSIRILILTVFEDEHAITEMLLHGANGYLLKKNCLKDLKKAILEVQLYSFYHSDLITPEFRKTLKNKKALLSGIASRELEFLELICKDLNYNDIAQLMHISHHTVETYRDNLFHKFNVRSRSALIVFAMRTGLLH